MPAEREDTGSDQYISYLYPTRVTRNLDFAALRIAFKSAARGTIVIRPFTSEGGSYLVIKGQDMSDQELRALMEKVKTMGGVKADIPKPLLRAITLKN